MPENWKTYKLEQISEIIDSLHRTPKYSEKGYPMVRVTDVKEGFLNLSNTLKVSKDVYEQFSKKYKPINGDIIMTRVGTYGTCSYVNTNEKFCLGQNTIVISPKIDNKFLYYSVVSPLIKRQIEAQVTGSTQKTISLKSIRALEIKLPDVRTQISIASILSTLDDKIELNLQMNKILEEMAMALYKHWFVDFGPFQEGEFVDSELGEIPKGWEVKSILELTDLLSGGTPKTKIAEYWNGTVNWVSAKDIGNGGNIYISDTEKKITAMGVENSSTKILPSDTVILVARGSVGKFGMIAKPMAMNQSCYGLFSKGELSQGLVYLMCSNLIEQFKRVSYGSVFDTITTSTFKATKVISPPSAVIKELRELIDPLFLELKSNIFENETLTQLRDTLLPKLISGEVRVKDVEKTLSEVL